MKRLPVETRLSYGRVHGVGDGAMWKKYYYDTTEERKERWRLTEENIDKKVEIAVEKKSSETVATAVASAKQVVVVCLLPWCRPFSIGAGKIQKKCSGFSPC